MNQPRVRGNIVHIENGKKIRSAFDAFTERGTASIKAAASFKEEGSGWRFTLTVNAPIGTRIVDASFETDLITDTDARVFLNGYQSWTDTREFSRNDRMRPPNKIVRTIAPKYRMTRYADYEFQRYPRGRGKLHGASLCWVRETNEEVKFAGSMDERSGFTFFHANLNARKLTVVKDCEGLVLTGPYTLFDIFFDEGSVSEVMDRWFALMQIERRPAKPSTGWTSWYNYYQNISEEIILGNLAALRQRNVPIDIFQIDDGYQTAVGDWLSVNDRFPGGMKRIADKIREAGFKPGIWLAPFAGETTSVLLRDHPDWFIRDDRGRPYATGGNWSGFYSLDIHNDDARAYIRHVFDVILNDWGFELVKLDFLYGACIRPGNGKTRGQIMCEAMDFIRECVGDREILGCGVPLWPAFGKVEYCRIGTDIDLQWHNELYGALIHREFPSTRNSLANSITRQHLDGRAFVNDPDVFLLRHTNITLTPEQRRTVFYINSIFGNLLFTSDDIREYTDEERRLYLSSFPFVPKRIIAADTAESLCTARFSAGGREYWFASNRSEDQCRVRMPGGLWYRAGSHPEEEASWLDGTETIVLPPFTSECFLLCAPEEPWTLMGSYPAAFPGAEIRSVSGSVSGSVNGAEIVPEGNSLEIRAGETCPAGSTAFIAVPESAATVRYNGKDYSVRETQAGRTKIRYAEIPLY